MTRCTLLVSILTLCVCLNSSFAACPSGYPNEIFCDDFDTYCTTGGFPGGTDCSAGAPVDDAKVQTVWQRTSVNEATSVLCGTEFTVDTDPVYWLSSPFGGRHRCLTLDEIGQSSVVNWTDPAPRTPGIDFLVNNVFPGSAAVQGTDEEPLVLEFYLSGVNRHEWGLGGGLARSTAYMELALGDARANTDHVLSPNGSQYCNPPISSGSFSPIICANALPADPNNGAVSKWPCPPLETAPIHYALAVGTMSFLDTEPNHCGVQEHGAYNWHLSIYDGQHWYSIRTNNPQPSGGELLVDPANPGAPMPPEDAAIMSLPGNFVLAAGKQGGDGPPNQWVKLTVKTSTFKVEMTSRELSSNGNYYLVTNVMDNIPRKYTGPFDQLRGGLGAGCELASSASWTNNCKPAGRHCIVGQHPHANAVIFDDVVLHGGVGFDPNGVCCLNNADCVANQSQEDCEALPPVGLGGRWQGPNSTCANTTCCPYPFADADGDTDVDQDDFGAFQVCYTGTDGGVPTGCSCFNRNNDGGIDNTDFISFKNCYTGANVPWIASQTPSCTP